MYLPNCHYQIVVTKLSPYQIVITKLSLPNCRYQIVITKNPPVFAILRVDTYFIVNSFVQVHVNLNGSWRGAPLYLTLSCPFVRHN